MFVIIGCWVVVFFGVRVCVCLFVVVFCVFWLLLFFGFFFFFGGGGLGVLGFFCFLFFFFFGGVGGGVVVFEFYFVHVSVGVDILFGDCCMCVSFVYQKGRVIVIVVDGFKTDIRYNI